jgi:hypothetical protein
VVAYSEGNKQLERVFVQRFFRDEFKRAFDAWLKTRPSTNPQSPPTPFGMKQYKVAELQESERLEDKASRLFEEGRAANQNSDNYVLATIFFAAVLFFSGIASKFDSDRIVATCLGFATLVFFAGLIRLGTLPFL